MTGLLSKVDFSRPSYVLMSHTSESVLIDAATGQPWHTYIRKEAKNMQTILRTEDKVATTLMTFIEALRILAKKEGVTLKPPYTMKAIQEQLIDARLRATVAVKFDTGAAVKPTNKINRKRG
jgi:hypothetical protein